MCSCVLCVLRVAVYFCFSLHAFTVFRVETAPAAVWILLSLHLTECFSYQCHGIKRHWCRHCVLFAVLYIQYIIICHSRAIHKLNKLAFCYQRKYCRTTATQNTHTHTPPIGFNRFNQTHICIRANSIVSVFACAHVCESRYCFHVFEEIIDHICFWDTSHNALSASKPIVKWWIEY